MSKKQKTSTTPSLMPKTRPTQTPKPGRDWRWMLLVLLCLLAPAIWFWRMVDSPRSHVLLPENGAEWIRLDEPLGVRGRRVVERVVGFKTRINIRKSTPDAILTVHAQKFFKVYLDGKTVHEEPREPQAWMRPRKVNLTPFLSPGTHWLGILVSAEDCHPALMTHCETLGIRTDASWEASEDIGNRWTPAMLAREPHTPEIAQAFPSPADSLLSIAPWLLLVFGAVAGWTLLHERGRLPAPRASTMRWVFLGCWLILGANNIFKLAPYVGMDAPNHLDYIAYLSQHGRVPLATDGWQMFQAPLFYLICAPIHKFIAGLGPDMTAQILRCIPLFCGVFQVQLCYRAMRAVFPDREDVQIAGMALGAFLPMNIYISQVIGNEPLAALFSSLAIVLVLERLRAGTSLLDLRFGGKLGLVLGLALLSKMSALFLILVLGVFCLLWKVPPPEEAVPTRIHRRRGSFILVFGSTLLLVAGWYYIRNWVLLGKPFVGGWDPERQIPWWQDHGYVTLQSLISFGKALVQPIYAQTSGFWDGLYATCWLDGGLSGQAYYEFRPAWNYSLVLGSALLALIPISLMAFGLVKAIRKTAVLLSLACIVVYVAALLHLYVSTLPVYSTIKATYLLGLLPCFAILLAAGMEVLPRKLWVRAVAHGLVATWVVVAYLGYFVR